MSVKIYKRGDRGFHDYGRRMECSYGTGIEVYESSAASAPHVWLKLETGKSMGKQSPGEGTAHLNARQAKMLVERLQTWLDEIPGRWGRPKPKAKETR